MSDSLQTNGPTSAGVAQAREPNHLLAAVGLGILINALIPASWLTLRIIYVIVAAATVFVVRSAGIGVPKKQTWFACTSRIIMTRLTKNPDQWWTVFSMFGAIVASYGRLLNNEVSRIIDGVIAARSVCNIDYMGSYPVFVFRCTRNCEDRVEM